MKVALVTGAASGIGRAVAERFLQEGYKVFGISRRANCDLSHPNFHYVSGDISSPSDREKFIALTDRIDVLVNAAGVAPKQRRDILELTEESYDYSYDTPTDGVMLMAGRSASNSMADAAPVLAEKKIIRTASMTIQTKTFEDSLNALKSACEGQGGWIESSSENVNSYTGLRTAYLTLRIPQTGLDAYLAGTEGLGRITSRSESADDVTESYQDTAARLATQQALMARLQALITESADLSDLLALESQIADTQYQIDRLQSSLNTTDRQVNYSTVHVTLQEEKNVPLTETTVSFGDRIISAIEMGFEALVEFLQDMVIFLVAALPFIVIVGAVVIVVKIIRRKKK